MQRAPFFGAAPKSHVRLLVERKTNHASALSSSSPFFPKRERERARARCNHLRPSRVELSRTELSFAHLQTNWANGVKITGARRSLTCLVRWARP